MASICGKITDDIERDCDQLPTGGVKSVIHVINYDDIDAVTYNVANPLFVTSIDLKTGAKAYKFEVYKRGHKPRFTTVKGDYGDRYKHEIDTSIQVWNTEVKAQISGLIGASVVVIVENLQNTGDARFEIYGLGQGLEVADGAVRNLAENDGVFAYTLASADDALEAKMPYTFGVFSTGGTPAYSYPLTQAALLALETPAT